MKYLDLFNLLERRYIRPTDMTRESSFLIDLGKEVLHRRGKKVEHLHEANIIASRLRCGCHFPLLDLDFPAELLPSSNPDHYHLYLYKKLTPRQMKKLVKTLYKVGIIQRGNYLRFKLHGALFLRKPGVQKGIELP
jgi:hypothetical protein